VDVSSGNSANVQASLPGRYAVALFELAKDGKAINAVEKSLGTLSAAMAESADLRSLTTNPLITRSEATKATAALAKGMKLDPLTANTLGVLAHNRRLSQAPAVISAFRALAASHRGETTADVTSAHPLSAAQVTALKSKLKSKIGRDVAVNLMVDREILGGLVVKIGSQMIDSSIRTRLNALATAMKG
jgi:F-type H+-transporting ATPase subunit delta